MANINQAPLNNKSKLHNGWKAPRDKNKLPHGEWITYYDTNNLCSIVNYKHGKVHGYYESYYYNNSLWHKGWWIEDRKYGFWIVNDKKRYYLWII